MLKSPSARMSAVPNSACDEIIENINPENLKKIVGAVWELPAK